MKKDEIHQVSEDITIRILDLNPFAVAIRASISESFVVIDFDEILPLAGMLQSLYIENDAQIMLDKLDQKEE